MESVNHEISVSKLIKFKTGELQELTKSTKNAINAGMGFGWVNMPTEEKLNLYWKGVLLVPNRWLFVGYFDGIIAGSIQVVTSTPSGEASNFRVSIDTHFVATWARGHGLARALIEKAENEALINGYSLILLDVRESQERAIKLYEQMNYIRWGTLPNYHKIGNNKMVAGHYYYKNIKE